MEEWEQLHREGTWFCPRSHNTANSGLKSWVCYSYQESCHGFSPKNRFPTKLGVHMHFTGAHVFSASWDSCPDTRTAKKTMSQRCLIFRGCIQALLALTENDALLLLLSLHRLLSLLLVFHPFISPYSLFSVSSLLLSLLVHVWKEVWLPGICCYSFLQTCLWNPGINCMLNHLLDWLGLDLMEVPAHEVMTFRAEVEWFEEVLFKGPVCVGGNDNQPCWITEGLLEASVKLNCEKVGPDGVKINDKSFANLKQLHLHLNWSWNIFKWKMRTKRGKKTIEMIANKLQIGANVNFRLECIQHPAKEAAVVTILICCNSAVDELWINHMVRENKFQRWAPWRGSSPS